MWIQQGIVIWKIARKSNFETFSLVIKTQKTQKKMDCCNSYTFRSFRENENLFFIKQLAGVNAFVKV